MKYDKDDMKYGKDGMSPRKSMAMGEGADFGADTLESMSVPHPEADGDLHKRMMKDGDRHYPVKHTAGKAHAQANPDHGRHDGPHGVDFGRKGMKKGGY